MLPVCYIPVFSSAPASLICERLHRIEWDGWLLRVCLCMCVCAAAELWWSIKSSQTKSSLSPHALCIGITFHQVTEKPQRCLSLASILKAKQRRCVFLTATVELSTCYINKSCISQQERRQQQPVWWQHSHKKQLNADSSAACVR